MVYFVTDGVHVKIGHTKALEERISALQVGNPRMLKFMYVFDGGVKEEKKLHAAFNKYKTEVNNEWFLLDQEVIRIILGSRNKALFNELGKAEGRADVYNKKIIAHFKKKDKSKSSKMASGDKEIKILEEVTKAIKEGRVVSYKPLIQKYGMTRFEIITITKRYNLSSKIAEHNKKCFERMK